MEQGIRLTTGAEFAARDAPPTPVQLERLLPAARNCSRWASRPRRGPGSGAGRAFPIPGRSSGAHRGSPVSGSPLVTRHWGLTLGPPTGRLIAEMMTGATPFCDPQPYAAERFTR